MSEKIDDRLKIRELPCSVFLFDRLVYVTDNGSVEYVDLKNDTKHDFTNDKQKFAINKAGKKVSDSDIWDMKIDCNYCHGDCGFNDCKGGFPLKQRLKYHKEIHEIELLEFQLKFGLDFECSSCMRENIVCSFHCIDCYDAQQEDSPHFCGNHN